MKTCISILGSTGSIGLSTLNIINNKRKTFSVYLLSANSNYSLISHQIKKYKPKFFIINDEVTFIKLKKNLKKVKQKY